MKQRSCARDCMKLWRSSLAGGVEEGEAMGRLLVALRKVQGFAELAEQLAQRNGTHIAIEIDSTFRLETHVALYRKYLLESDILSKEGCTLGSYFRNGPRTTSCM